MRAHKTKPTANAGQDQTVKARTPVYFDARGFTGNIISYEWNFGDGKMGRGLTCSHTYAEPLTSVVMGIAIVVALFWKLKVSKKTKKKRLRKMRASKHH